ncbi:MAG: aspartate ammonia-lyase [Verrucomicrobiota bacterium]
MRTEKDSLGEKQVPADAYYGVHTARSIENFGVAGERLPREIIYAMVQLKWACAKANQALGVLPADKAEAIVTACRRVLTGEFDAQFPVDVFQAGSGTSSNMNVNEVIANIACEVLGGKRGDRKLVHPNDHVNWGQSTNNVFPSAIKIAAVELSEPLLAGLRKLVGQLAHKAKEFADVIKSGRTHLRDAVPVTLGQEFAAYARALEKDVHRVEQAAEKLLELGIGGNAIGTGINTKKEFRPAILRELKAITARPYRVAENGIEITQFMTDLADLSSALKLLALDLIKICNDLRLLSSGPNTGFNEIALPPVEAGSSIMPGKVNPSLCEAATMACIEVLGLDHAVAIACGAGQLELNTHMPLIGYNLVQSLHLLQRTCVMLADRCVAGIEANREVCARYFETSAGLATVLNPKLGYDKVAELVKESLQTKKTLRELVLEKKLLGEKELEDILKRSTGPSP